MIAKPVLIGLALVLAACGQEASTGAANTTLTARDMVLDCGLFTDPYSKRMLELEFPNRAKLTILSPAAKEDEDVMSSKNIIESKGTFSIEPSDSALVVEVNGTRTRYEAYSPPTPTVDGCILLSGTQSAADLSASWFGTVARPEGDNPADQP
jgi:hypothetical protein